LAVKHPSSADTFSILVSVISQSINRDENWKRYYASEMNKTAFQRPSERILGVLELERNAEYSFMKGEYAKSVSLIQEIINNHIEHSNSSELGWYTQEKARYSYKIDKSESNKIQASAHKYNTDLLKPNQGVIYEKKLINPNRIEVIKGFVSNFTDYEQLSSHIEDLFSNLKFGIPADKFERALYDLGRALGFGSDRPDKSYNVGPDNLWSTKTNEYILFECKNMVELTRKEINKSESGQMNNHLAWFSEKFGNVKVTNILIFPTQTLAKGAGFNEEVRIMRELELNKLAKAVKYFFKNFISFDLSSITINQINDWIVEAKITPEDFDTKYCVEVKKIR
jgi:hypothetical protein